MVLAVTVLALGACAQGSGDGGGDDEGLPADANRPPPDSSATDAPMSLSDAWVLGDALASIDATATAPDGGSDLDPNLSVPDPGNQVCMTPGSLSDTECPGVQVCRFYDSSSGRCDSCSPCGNLNASCSASDQCDILFMCYLGRCTNFCTLSTTECGAPQNCVDIGHPTRGVCDPFA